LESAAADLDLLIERCEVDEIGKSLDLPTFGWQSVVIGGNHW
jgi:hypothetical protein